MTRRPIGVTIHSAGPVVRSGIEGFLSTGQR